MKKFIKIIKGILILSYTVLVVSANAQTRDVSSEALGITLESLDVSLQEIRYQAKNGIRQGKEESTVSNRDDIVKPTNVNPPNGAIDYIIGRAEEIVVVDSKIKSDSRENSKGLSDKGSAPLQPSVWNQLGFDGKSYTPKPGVDERLLSAINEIKDRDYSYGFLISNQYLGNAQTDELLKYGVEILGQHSSAYKVKLPLNSRTLQSVAALPYVEWLGYALTEQKTEQQITQAIKDYQQSIDELPVLINFFDREASELYSSALAKKGITLGQYDTDLEAYYAAVPIKTFDWLTAQDYVLFVELDTLMELSHDQSMASMGVDYIRNEGRFGYTGASVEVGIIDTGFMLGNLAEVQHDSLRKNGCGKNFTSGQGVWNDVHGHGTAMLSTFGGNGSNPQLNGASIGIGENSAVPIRAAKAYMKGGGGSSSSWTLNAMDFMAESESCSGQSLRPKIVNLSAGSHTNNGGTGTGSRSRKLDAKVWKHKQIYVVSAGNEGWDGVNEEPNEKSIRQPATAKNALSVGSVRDSFVETVGSVSNLSSRGPTKDGRMKPNLMAIGEELTVANAGTVFGSRNASGTSPAAAHVSGIAATLMEHYPEFKDKPYLLRAHLMATAILHDDGINPINNTNGGRNTYGLGRASAYASHWSRPNTDGWEAIWGSTTISDTKWSYRDISVPVGAERLMVVMAWDEPAASAGADKAVNYDIDLWDDQGAICSPDSKGQCGEWASQSWDDNVEYLIIDNPMPGKHRLKFINWVAPSSGIDVGFSALIIKGDLTPATTLSAIASNYNPAVGEFFKITTNVNNPSYIASGVHIEATQVPDGVVLVGMEITLKDGTKIVKDSSDISDNDLYAGFTLGNIIENDSREVTWEFWVGKEKAQEFKFRSWSENGGSNIVSLVINCTQPSLCVFSNDPPNT